MFVITKRCLDDNTTATGHHDLHFEKVSFCSSCSILSSGRVVRHNIVWRDARWKSRPFLHLSTIINFGQLFGDHVVSNTADLVYRRTCHRSLIYWEREKKNIWKTRRGEENCSLSWLFLSWYTCTFTYSCAIVLCTRFCGFLCEGRRGEGRKMKR